MKTRNGAMQFHRFYVTGAGSLLIAALAVSELPYLDSEKRGTGSVEEEFVLFSKRKFSSHAYQRVGLLQSMLQALLEKVKENPNWLYL